MGFTILGRPVANASPVLYSVRFFFMWRRLHCLMNIRRAQQTAERLIDAGYCLDRYTIDRGEIREENHS